MQLLQGVYVESKGTSCTKALSAHPNRVSQHALIHTSSPHCAVGMREVCGHPYLVLEDLAAQYTSPCVLDAKVGLRTWYPWGSQALIDKYRRAGRGCPRGGVVHAAPQAAVQLERFCRCTYGCFKPNPREPHARSHTQARTLQLTHTCARVRPRSHPV